jgi:SNF2 family DNA or RNA helicase
LDEAQNIRNPESVTYRSAMLIEADHYLTLSGTPIENTLTDLWAQMNFLNRGLLGDLNFFRTHFATPIEKYDDKIVVSRLQRLVQPFLLRRTKQEVTPELPELTELVRYCEMTDMQRSLYEEEKSKARNEIIESIEELGVSQSSIMILRALMRLRQLAIHPAMLNPDYTADSGKFDQIAESLESPHSEGHKALLFSSFTKHLDLVAAHLQKENIQYAMLTGKTRNREEVIERFSRCDDVPFFLISLKAGGIGLNLTAAGYVFLLDPWWNPAAERQAISRAHRIGQTEKVFAYRLISSDTIEEKILKLQEKKTALAEIFATSANPFRNMSADDIIELFE